MKASFLPETSTRVLRAFSSLLFLFFLFAGFPPPSHAQFLARGARSPALGGAGVGLLSDVWGAGNPASWATVSRRSLSIFASQGFGLSELALGALQYLQPLPQGVLTLSARSFGFEAHRENEAILGYARTFQVHSLRAISIGLRANWFHVSQASYGAASTVGLTLGIAFGILPYLSAGFQAKHFNGPHLRKREPLEQSLSFGFSFHPSSALILVSDLIKVLHFPASLHIGMEWRPVQAIVLRHGVSSMPVRVTLGLGIERPHLACNLVFEKHEVLGWSPGAGISLF